MTYYSHASGVPALLTRGVSSLIRSEFDLIQAGFTAAEAADVSINSLKADKASPALTGVPTAPTAVTGTSTTQLATTAFVSNTALSAALPSQSGNSGKFVTTDGTNASWATPAAGALIYLSTVTATAASTVDIETGFGATYDDYLIICDSSTSAADTVFCRWKFSGSYDTASNYLNSFNASSGSGLDPQLYAYGISGTKNMFHYKLFNINSAVTKIGQIFATGVNANPTISSLFGGHTNTVKTTALQGVRFYCSGGATITGTFKLYGIAKA